MNSKERVYKTIKHERTDRVPIHIWYHPDVMKSLEKNLKRMIKTLKSLGNDIIQTWISIDKTNSGFFIISDKCTSKNKFITLC